MIVVESNKEIENFLNRWNNEPSIIIPVWSDLEKHPLNNELSFLFVRMGNTDFILIYNHIDGKSQHLDLSTSTQPKWVCNKKGLLQMDTKIQNLFDIHKLFFDYFFYYILFLMGWISESSSYESVEPYAHLRYFFGYFSFRISSLTLFYYVNIQKIIGTTKDNSNYFQKVINNFELLC